MKFVGHFAFLVLLVSSSVRSDSVNSFFRQVKDIGFVDTDPTDPGEPLLLTPYIESGDLEAGRNASRVTLEAFPNLESYSGFFNVNKTFNSNLFFWFFPAKDGNASAPVILWLQGGPGGSSLFGLFVENGPITFVSDSEEPRLRGNTSWGDEHHVLYIDNPAGTGYSFTDEDGYCTDQVQIGQQLLTFLRQFFTLYSEYRENEFFITGESYAGKYVPAISYAILKGNEQVNEDERINLKGLAIGDGLSDPLHQHNYAEFLYQIGVIDLNQKEVMLEVEKEVVQYIQEESWLNATNAFWELSGLFNYYSRIYDNYNYLDENDPSGILNELYSKWVQLNKIRQAIHVGNLSYDSGYVYEKLQPDISKSVAPWVSELLSNYRVLIYNGQVDVIVAYPLTRNYLQNLEFNGADEYAKAIRYPWYVKGELAGYFKQGGNLTELLVRNAGHMVPYDQPVWSQDLIYRFARNIPYEKNN